MAAARNQRIVVYGATHSEGALIAHAWVRAGPIGVVGCEGKDEFVEVAWFPP